MSGAPDPYGRGDYRRCRVQWHKPETTNMLYKYAQGGKSVTIQAGRPAWYVVGFGRPHVLDFHEIYETRREARARVRELKNAWKKVNDAEA